MYHFRRDQPFWSWSLHSNTDKRLEKKDHLHHYSSPEKCISYYVYTVNTVQSSKWGKDLTFSKYLPLLKGLMLSKESLLGFIGIILPGLLTSKEEKKRENGNLKKSVKPGREENTKYNCITSSKKWRTWTYFHASCHLSLKVGVMWKSQISHSWSLAWLINLCLFPNACLLFYETVLFCE